RKLAVDRAEKAVQAETAAIAARRQAEQAAADAAKAKEDRTQVLALLAHELRAPNNTIRRLAGRLLREAAGEARRPLDPARLPQDLQLIQAEASRFEELFQNWRRVVDVVFHGRQPQARQVDLRACLERAFSEDLRLDAIARGFHVELPEVSIDARADDVLVERCLTNLLSNALKYGAEKPGDTVRVSLEALAGEVAVHVDDWGEGVPHHERKEIFKAYHRAQRHRDGTPIPGAGLGLYLVRQASVAMGGTVDVRNHKEMPQRPCGDRGARFTLTLPRWT
ncbi:MAG TPA: HAMP domain-containing sensor histidine kinase, partial [Myxococcota bacterium]|nr:HAMP domain-containing sensor histidine kinase [Myxococcota bacterium]